MSSIVIATMKKRMKYGFYIQTIILCRKSGRIQRRIITAPFNKTKAFSKGKSYFDAVVMISTTVYLPSRKGKYNTIKMTQTQRTYIILQHSFCLDRKSCNFLYYLYYLINITCTNTQFNSRPILSICSSAVQNVCGTVYI